MGIYVLTYGNPWVCSFTNFEKFDCSYCIFTTFSCALSRAGFAVFVTPSPDVESITGLVGCNTVEPRFNKALYNKVLGQKLNFITIFKVKFVKC